MNMTRTEFNRQSDDVEGYTFVVTYKDRATFPPQRFFATEEAAMKEAGGARPVQNVMVRKLDANANVLGLRIFGEAI